MKRKRPIEVPNSAWQEAISRELKKAERLFVLGIGNRQKGDDAAGGLCIHLLEKELARRKRHADVGSATPARPRVAKRQTPRFEIQVLDAGETPEGATGLIREFRPTHVLIIDAAVRGHQPGTIFVIDTQKIGQEEISTHRIPLVHLVRYLEETVGCRVILIGIEPQEVDWGKPVSAPVRGAAASLAAWLGETLTALCL